MKNNLVQKTVGKWKLWTAIAVVLLVVGIVIASVFGFNSSVDFQSAKTVTVEYGYVANVEDLKTVCDDSFAESGVKPVKVVTAKDGEIIYYFAEKTNVSDAVVDALEADVATANVVSIFKVRANTENFVQGLSEGYILRAGIALGVFAVLAFLYVALRYRLSMGIAMVASLLSSVGVTVAIVACTRIPVSASFAYVVAFSVLLTAVMVLLSFHRIRDNAKDKADKELSAQERAVNGVSVKHVAVLSISLTVAVALLVLIPSAGWFALCAWLGIVGATYSSLLLAPALFAVLDGAIKGGDKPIFTFKKKEKKNKKAPVAAPAVEAPVAEEKVVEETPAEEPAVEEREEVLEESTEDGAEAPVEEEQA